MPNPEMMEQKGLKEAIQKQFGENPFQKFTVEREKFFKMMEEQRANDFKAFEMNNTLNKKGR